MPEAFFSNDDKQRQKTQDMDLIDEAKKRLQMCIDADDGDRAEALDDLQFRVGGDFQWDDEAVRQRDLDGRPRLTINNIPAIIHQVTGDIRQNRQSIHVHPVDDKADKDVAEVIEGLIRHIEYDSGADAAYDTALGYACTMGFGFFRLVTEYADPMSFDQCMKIKRVKNPFTIYIDPSCQEADGSDMMFAFATSKVTRDEFDKQYPRKDGSQDYIVRGVGDNANWIGEDFVRITEYYRVEETEETLVLMSDGSTRIATDRTPPPPGVFPTDKTRKTQTRKIMWYKLTAVEVLEKAEIPFNWIPIFPVYGDEIDLDGTTIREGITRHAKSPAQAYNYWITSATEEIAMRTKTPFIGAAGQFENFEDDWANANTRQFAYLEYNPVTLDGSLAPPPQRQAPADVPTGFIAMAGLARDNVKAVTGIYDASLGNRSNETSGIAIRARQKQGDVGNFHFADNFTRAIRHLGRTIVSGIPKIYDAPRIERIMGVDGTSETKPINMPEVKQVQDPDTGMIKAIKTVVNNLTVGRYDVTVSTGPAYNTLREEAADSMVAMAQSWPKMMEIAGDKVVRSMDWPGANEIADRIAKTLPPGLADEEEDELMVQTPKGPIPAQQAGQLIGQMDQALEQMSQELEEAQSGLIKAKMDNESRERIAEMNNTSKMDVEELKGMIALLQQNIAPPVAAAASGGAAETAKTDNVTPNAPDISAALLEVLAGMNKPRRKKMSIMAPSGQVYEGEIGDVEDELPPEMNGAELPPETIGGEVL